MTTAAAAASECVSLSSELGTHAYWEAFYERERANFESSSAGDEGQNWFSETVGERLVSWLVERLDDGRDALDLGCGNGAWLFQLEERQWKGRLVGIDYSEGAVAMARAAAKNRESRADFAHADLRSFDDEAFPFVHDKGTYDAFMLGEDARTEAYVEGLLKVLAPGGTFAITSCNFTAEELEAALATASDGHLVAVDRLPYPTFRFGGREGAAVSTVLFRRQSRE